MLNKKGNEEDSSRSTKPTISNRTLEDEVMLGSQWPERALCDSSPDTLDVSTTGGLGTKKGSESDSSCSTRRTMLSGGLDGDVRLLKFPKVS